LPVFQFSRAFSIVRNIKIFLKMKMIESKKQELSGIRNELRTAKEQEEDSKHRKRKKENNKISFS
jgi:hypothetical protein